MSVEHLQFISRTHFKLKRDSRNSPFYLEDFSRNGTFINGEKVGKGNRRILQNEDVIAIDHPFIVSVYNIVETPEAVFLVLELMNGGDLYNKIKESKYLKKPIVKNIIYQIAVAVNYLHRQNITHRDLKPENIPLQRNTIRELLLSNYQTADQICKGKYSFKQCIWSSVSAECKDLISKMLKVDPKTRYSSSEVLNHKWLQDPDVIKRYNNLLNQENEKQEITVSDLEDSINEHCNNSCPENCLDIIEPPAKRHRSLLIF
ncbi:ovarian-specific serine/threonine-protein kinase Lok-like [Ctenocephalides felis]|uniref:ovarian-specific serine/threonine-protein kinase Lok-like n=1 Tax=Ctenocephalides felis TaxID=7515 RepID=UPI000E6E2B02|nr:ovarian-specific serine/threonine-protein kinase Lok-like [Ctenocephalides felis]XP_026475921.1 ovarian-specific serine/threonine-protein kinase Lok-like [Ctenocephalides felis]